MTLLKVDNIDAYYGEVQVLRGISLDIKKGETVALLGNNGSGKSSLVSCISGILDHSRGSIHFNGEDISDVSSYERVALGLVQVPEGRRIFPTLSVEENLFMGSYLKEAKAARPKSLERVFTLFPILEERKKQLGGTLSGGQQQMLAIGRGLMALPKLLILDEASLGLAPLVVEEIFEVIKEIASEGVTILLVEQNVSKSLALANRAYVLEEGVVAMSGQASDMINDPLIKELYLGMSEEEVGNL
jgi:branched-chain amino acid transport system ATP-binding protein